ncbi:hypothetical protein [Thermus altitudinis]|uniref:hypothetical protein n=1 Tax=Thermus altitudinis TaxID=2908145 RepID=UPI001FA99A9A
MRPKRVPLRPRFLYLCLWVRGPWPLPLVLILPLFALEWGLMLAVLLQKTRRLSRPVPFGAFFALRSLPPVALVWVQAEGVEVKVGLW